MPAGNVLPQIKEAPIFKRSGPQRPVDQETDDIRAEICPKCGYAQVVGDSCARCRVKVSTYRIHLATLGEGALVPRAPGPKRGWLKKLSMIVPRSPTEPSARLRSSYEQLILTRIYRELCCPPTTRGIYVVLLAFDVTTAGRPSAVRLTVYPPNPEVAASVRAALNQAQPFPLPLAGGHGSKSQPVSLALTVSI